MGARLRSNNLALAAITLASIMGPIDASAVNVALPTIATFFDVDISTVQWIPAAHLLAVSSLILLFGRAGDVFGCRRIFLLGIVGFTSSSILCGLSASVRWLIAFRVLQGVMASMMMAVAYALVAVVFPPSERGKALGVYTLGIAAGLTIGPILGGLVTSILGWRYVFIINIPVGASSVIMALKSIPEVRGGSGKLDIYGAIAISTFLLSLLLFLSRIQISGFSPASIGLLALSSASLALLIYLEFRVPQPLLSPELFRNKTFSFANLSAMLNYISQYIIFFLTPFYLQRILHLSSSDAGAVMTAFPLAFLLLSPVSGALSDRIGTRILASLGSSLCAVSLILMSQLGGSASALDIVLRLLLFGLGVGIFQPPNNSAIMGSAPKTHMGVASGVLATLRNVGMAFGVSVSVVILRISAPAEALYKPYLEGLEADLFLLGLRKSYLVGAILAGISALTSLIQQKDKSPLKSD